MFKWLSKGKKQSVKREMQDLRTEKQVISEPITLDSFIIEYLWKYKNNYNNLRVEEVFSIFNEMLNKNDICLSHTIKMQLTVKLAKAIIRDSRLLVDHFRRAAHKRLLAALYLICDKYKFNYYQIIADVIFDPSVDAKARNVEEEIIPCNFASFADVITLEREYDLELDEILQDIADIWTDYFEYLMDFIDEESLDTIKKMEILSDSNTWSMRLEMYIEEAECPSFETANLLVNFFGNEDMTVDIHYWLIKSVLNKFCNSDFADVAIASEQFITIIQQMADYAKYQSIEFEMQDSWKAIIRATIVMFDGITLNKISNLLIQSFSIPKEKIEDCITAAMYDHLATLEEAAEKNPVEKIEGIYDLLSNPTVFKVVSVTDNEIIKLFEC